MEVSDQIKVFQKLYNVPRETIDQFTEYHKLLIESQEKTNLVGSGTISSIWTRHFSDSAKLTDRIISHKNKHNNSIRVCDVGSGAGFPGLVCFLILLSQTNEVSMTLIESNKKKCEFLARVKKKLMLSVSIINERVEKVEEKYDVILSRAVAPLHNLLKLLLPLSKKYTVFLLPKGKNYQKEIEKAKKLWKFSYKIVKNSYLLDKSGGVTLEIVDLKKK
ncbi:MAG: 16S rRNA (guanine(527)-N(7))-methyltransferase RsmG [Rickettsiales bacterium]|nr:16S rRNA (guanine(527)-N(7))-methyltransferase RsmG [Rickettsiales bacterium]RPG13716.1 MAG: 16S rRNA (guanine(527)-N(7))-methyltransferase RsmG [Pelagibacteraceae bacterium TMED195]